MEADLKKTKQELEKQHSERARIKCVSHQRISFPLILLPDSQLEKEVNEKLGQIYQQLLQASVDRQESEKEAKLKETLANLSRIFPGMHLFLVCDSVTDLGRRCPRTCC